MALCACVCVWGGASKRWGPRGVFRPRCLLSISQDGYMVQSQVEVGSLRSLTKAGVSGFLRRDTAPCSEKPLSSSMALPSSVIGACVAPSLPRGRPPALSYPPRARASSLSPHQEGIPHSKADSLPRLALLTPHNQPVTGSLVSVPSRPLSCNPLSF